MMTSAIGGREMTALEIEVLIKIYEAQIEAYRNAMNIQCGITIEQPGYGVVGLEHPLYVSHEIRDHIVAELERKRAAAKVELKELGVE